MQDFAKAIADYWLVVLVVTLLPIFEAGRRLWRWHVDGQKRADPVKPQFTQIDGDFKKYRDGKTVALRIHLHNPHPYPVKIVVQRMKTTIGFRHTDEVPPKSGEMILSPGTSRVRVESGEVVMSKMPSSGSITGYVDWVLNCGRADLEPIEFTENFILRGDVGIRERAGGPEVQWRPYDDSDQLIDPEDMTIIRSDSGEITRIGN